MSFSGRRTRAVAFSAAAWTLLACGIPCEAGSWIFRRSYYSHQPQTPVHVGGHAPTRVYYTRPQGGYLRGGYRHLRVGGDLRNRNDDHHHFFEAWFQHGGQF